jgi:hypothetical protein
VDNHAALARFDQHCYRGLLNRKRFERALELFEGCAAAIEDHGLPFRIGFLKELLNSIVLASEETGAAALQGSLWTCVGSLASLAGLRGPGEYPATAVLCSRLRAAGLLSAALTELIDSPDADVARQAAEELLHLLA